MQDETILLIVAILAVTAIELTAIIHLHIDGVLMSGIVSAIVGIALRKEDAAKQLRGFIYGRNNNICRPGSSSSRGLCTRGSDSRRD